MHALKSALFCAGLLAILAPRQGAAATFTVANTLETGPGSLRQAITDANASSGLDLIHFNIPPGGHQIIIITNDLPTVTDSVEIDGTTQPGFSGTPIIELAGSGSPFSSLYALRLQAHGNLVRGLVINRFTWYGIFLEPGSSQNRVEGNWIGLDATGTLNLGMNGNGITINGGTNNLIGGTNAASRNVIAGNTVYGVAILGGRGNVVQGNYIGTDAYGTNAIGNGYAFDGTGNWAGGVWIEGGGTNTIGGDTPGAGNLISGNVRGVVLYNGAKGNLIQGNLVGPVLPGNARPPGRIQHTGIYIMSSDGNLVGGTNALARNVISANGSPTAGTEGNGVYLRDCTGNVVQGNFIGTDAGGTLALGNVYCGVQLEYGGNSNIIGGTVAGARNVISGNGDKGVRVWQCDNNSILGNYVGTQADGASPLGNANGGIHIYNGNGTSVGGSTASAGNVIAFNGTPGAAFGGFGIFVSSEGSNTSTNNLIRRNSIHSNASRGIWLFNLACYNCPPYNDSGDSDSGPNNLQNFPVLAAAATSAGSINISGSLNSKASAGFTIDLFASPEIDDSGFGEGKTWIGSTSVVTDGAGNAAINAFFADAGFSGQFITATATDTAKNTSEFSAAIVADGTAGALMFEQAAITVGEQGGLATIGVTRVAGTEGAVTVHYATSGGTATAGNDYTATAGTLTFASGETYQSFSIPILNDTLNEQNETVTLTLDSPTGGALLGPRKIAVLTILDNDPILVNAGDAAVTKPATGTTVMQFPITLSSPAAGTTSVAYATGNLTAEAGIDYLSTTGRVDFAPGATNQSITVTILADGLQEGSKSFLFTLSNPTNLVLGDSQALGAIYDGTQGVLQFGSAAYTINENGGFATVEVTRVGGSLGPVSVAFSATGGSATAGSDFTATNGVLNFSNGQTIRSFTIPIIDDPDNEAPETILAQLGNPAGTTLTSPSTAVVTIQDNDLPPELTIHQIAGLVVLSWPAQATGFQLVTAPNPLETNWAAVTNVPVIAGDRLTVTNFPGQLNQFYRLQR